MEDKNRVQIIRALIQNGCNPKAVNKNTKMTALHWTAYHSNQEQSIIVYSFFSVIFIL